MLEPTKPYGLSLNETLLPERLGKVVTVQLGKNSTSYRNWQTTCPSLATNDAAVLLPLQHNDSVYNYDYREYVLPDGPWLQGCSFAGLAFGSPNPIPGDPFGEVPR